MRLILVALLAAGAAGPGWAQDCPNPQGWAKAERHLAARTPDMRFALKPGGALRIGLSPPARVKFAAGRPSRRGYAGMAAIDVAKPGTLSLATGNSVYVDLVRNGKALPLAREPKTNGCPGIRKMLDFKVLPGRYLVQLSGSPARSVRIATSLR